MGIDLKQIIGRLPSPPILFVGSGLTRRYLGLPSWDELLRIFAQRMSTDEFVYDRYVNLAKASDFLPCGLNPKIASLIEADFNNQWYSTPSFRQAQGYYLHKAHGVSPFKCEVAMFISQHGSTIAKYESEIEKFSALSYKNLSGIITTNYDTFLESKMDGYSTIIGQDQLIFSAIQGVGEIYKIHGSVIEPESLILTESDYLEFDTKKDYLAAKLRTLFMEYPIVFLGYSLSDTNVQQILKSIVKCLTEENMRKLQERFFFINYNSSAVEATSNVNTFLLGEKSIAMTTITLKDFAPLYDALAENQNRFPAKILRMFRQEFYDFTITNQPTAKIRVAFIDDKRINDDDLVLAFGQASDFGKKGIIGIELDDWYSNLLLNNLGISSDDMLKDAYPNLYHKYHQNIPLNKYLATAINIYPDYNAIVKETTFDNLISSTIRRCRATINMPVRGINELSQFFANNFEKATRLMAHLEEHEIDVDELESFLLNVLKKDPKFFIRASSAEKSNFRRLIRIYDYLKYHNTQKSLGSGK